MDKYPIELLDYELPSELIAQVPLDDRTASRMMHVDRRSGKVLTLRFTDLKELLRPGDVLVLNDSRVINGRIHGRKLTGGAVEILVLKELDGKRFRVLAEVRGGMKTGDEYLLENDFLVRVTGSDGDGTGTIQAVSVLPDDYVGDDFTLESMSPVGDMPVDVFAGLFYREGGVPTPPYIRTRLEEPERYQTVYARTRGSAAAPTAGLHFTDGFLNLLAEKGIEIHKVTLHVGIGTFLPIRADDLSHVEMHKEEYAVPRSAATAIATARREKRRVVAVGTTSVRTLETVFDESNLDDAGEPVALTGESGLFIYPGYPWRIVDAMLTNFHLPRSTLLAMIYSFGGRELIRKAYDKAIVERFRFYSFGDCMFIE